MITQLSWVKNHLFPTFIRDQWWLLSALLMLVAILSLLPLETFPKIGYTRTDLIVHFLMYGSMAYALAAGFYSHLDTVSSISWRIFILPLVLGLYGLAMEVLQKILPIRRFFSWEDAVSNTIGACSFFVFVYIIRKK
jgi:VanZ family protein